MTDECPMCPCTVCFNCNCKGERVYEVCVNTEEGTCECPAPSMRGAKFFSFAQNNIQGFFDINVGHYVVIEATDAEHANFRATTEEVGIDFGDNCSCCGYRWSRASEDDGAAHPHIDGEEPSTYFECPYKAGRFAVIHFMDDREPITVHAGGPIEK